MPFIKQNGNGKNKFGLVTTRPNNMALTIENASNGSKHIVTSLFLPVGIVLKAEYIKNTATH